MIQSLLEDGRSSHKHPWILLELLVIAEIAQYHSLDGKGKGILGG